MRGIPNSLRKDKMGGSHKPTGHTSRCSLDISVIDSIEEYKITEIKMNYFSLVIYTPLLDGTPYVFTPKSPIDKFHCHGTGLEATGGTSENPGGASSSK